MEGTKSPRNRVPKNGADSKLSCSPGCKCEKCVKLDFVRGDVADIGTAPTSRVYTRDYSKVGREEGDVDLVTDALGRNPFRI